LLGPQQLDYERRKAFCEWLLRWDTAAPTSTFLSRVLLMDEACFARNVILNNSNQHTWADENWQAFKKQKFAITGDLFLGSYEPPPRLWGGGASDLQFMSKNFPQLLDDVLLATRQTMYVLHDKAVAQSSSDVMRYSDCHYPGRWIERNGPVVWPPWSPDLAPADCAAIWRASFTPNDITRGTSCLMSLNRLRRQYDAICLTSLSGPRIVGVTGLLWIVYNGGSFQHLS
jgi:hypothetical protein